jgi:glyoxylase I family protein
MNPSTERPFTLDHLDHVVLRVRDLQKSIAFYKLLGGDVAGERPAGTAVRITPNQTIILQSQPDYVPAELSALDHINLFVNAADIRLVADYLQANGVELARELTEGSNTVRVLDPDQNVVDLSVPRPR